MPKEVVVFVVDCDDCLYNNAFKASTDDEPLEKTNLSLIDYMRSVLNSGMYDHGYCMAGSVRQDETHQVIRQGQREFSYFKLLIQLTDITKRGASIPFEVDGYVMADAQHRLPHGRTFENVLKGQISPVSTWWVDMSKRTIVFGDAQKKLNEPKWKDATITFIFIDDNKDMLQRMMTFYHDYSEIMPSRFKLKAMHYDGALHGYVKTDDGQEIVQGIGLDDPNWEANFRRFVQLGDEPTSYGNTSPLVFRMREFLYCWILTPLALCDVFKKQIDATFVRAFPYQRALQQPFLESLYFLQEAILAQVQTYIAEGKEEAFIMQSNAARIARETMVLLHDASHIPLFNYDYISSFDKARNATLKNYAKRCYPTLRSHFNYFFSSTAVDTRLYSVLEQVEGLIHEEEMMMAVVAKQS